MECSGHDLKSPTQPRNTLINKAIAKVETVPLWAPMPPPVTNTIKSIQSSAIHQNFNLNLNINFERANSISTLRQITAIMFEHGDVFIGLDLVYSNGEHELYGRRAVDSENLPKANGAEVPFAIEGSRGERISRVEVLHSPADGGNVYAIQVC